MVQTEHLVSQAAPEPHGPQTYASLQNAGSVHLMCLNVTTLDLQTIVTYARSTQLLANRLQSMHAFSSISRRHWPVSEYAHENSLCGRIRPQRPPADRAAKLTCFRWTLLKHHESCPRVQHSKKSIEPAQMMSHILPSICSHTTPAGDPMPACHFKNSMSRLLRHGGKCS